MNILAEWVPLLPEDMDSVNSIADAVHTTLPERPEVFMEKRNLFPDGCRKLALNGRTVGYAISHPWMLYSIPPLDDFLETLPTKPDCMYLHDMVVLPEARGAGASGRYMQYIKAVTRSMGIRSIACVSVYGTDVLWSRFGFQVIQTPDLIAKLSTYGATGKYMVCHQNE
ncbi:MAG: GNAT family N-acetyltransferase [Verrucomicrobia bacterium]|nr:GNAT family N-acetyltransferase [Verrucomicrobiota bacterium]